MKKLADTELQFIDVVDGDIYFHNQNVGRLSDGIDCEICKNRGNIAFRKNNNFFIKPCSCSNRRKAKRNAEQSNMGELLNLSLGTYVAKQPWQKNIKESAQKYIDDCKGWFVILGQSGCGKTHVCSSIANSLLKTKPVKYVIWNEFVSDIKQAIRESQDYSLIEELSKVETLYIDDLFKGGCTDADKRYAFEILNARYNKKLATIISSELYMEEIERIDVAVAGRINQMAEVIEIKKDMKKNYRLHLDEVV